MLQKKKWIYSGCHLISHVSYTKLTYIHVNLVTTRYQMFAPDAETQWIAPVGVPLIALSVFVSVWASRRVTRLRAPDTGTGTGTALHCTAPGTGAAERRGLAVHGLRPGLRLRGSKPYRMQNVDRCIDFVRALLKQILHNIEQENIIKSHMKYGIVPWTLLFHVIVSNFKFKTNQ